MYTGYADKESDLLYIWIRHETYKNKLLFYDISFIFHSTKETKNKMTHSSSRLKYYISYLESDNS